MSTLETLRKHKLVPVLRAPSRDEGLRMANALVSGGISVLEITMTVPGAIELIAELKKALPKTVCIGAGTVLDAETAKKCVDAGAEFVVSPALNVDVVAWCTQHEVLCAPGCLTPTEVLAAHEAGARLIKIFPCDAMGGANYVKALKGPFPHIEFMPTGGVNLDTIPGFLAAGAVAVGVGTNLVNPKLSDNDLSQLARQYVEIVQ